MSIFDEAQQLEELAAIGKALIKYASSIEAGLVFERQDGWWLPAIEKNFVGFQFHWSDALSITLSLYGAPEDQFKQDDLIIRKAKFNYSKCILTDESQLMAASVCIWRAHQLFHRERQVETGSLLLVDDRDGQYTEWLRPRPRGPRTGDYTQADPAETGKWFEEVRDFMEKNNLVDASINA